MAEVITANSVKSGELRIVIIGAGLSGIALFVNMAERLLVESRPCEIVLINKGKSFARGLAYGTSSANHLLNVPSARMSILPGKPDDFLEYLHEEGLPSDPVGFVPRAHFGAYLKDRFNSALHMLGENCTAVKVKQLSAEVVDLQQVSHGSANWKIELKGQTALWADKVVLATGNFSPEWPSSLKACANKDPARCINDPWDWLGKEPMPKSWKNLLLVGTGLTMMDVALDLSNRGFDGHMTAVSRRGLSPQPHRGHPVSVPKLLASQLLGLSPLQLLKFLRTFEATYVGADWRDGLAAMREHTPAIWQSWSLCHRRQFLRHLRPYWDTHRHRCAPFINRRLHSLVGEGLLSLKRARVASVTSNSDGFLVSLCETDTKGRVRTSQQFDAIINCTGPTLSAAPGVSPVLDALRQLGLLQVDDLGLGLEVTSKYEVTHGSGVYYLGPMLRAQFWEATAVPELRIHAQLLAEVLI